MYTSLSLSIYIYIYIIIYLYLSLSLYIYIYIERERERERFAFPGPRYIHWFTSAPFLPRTSASHAAWSSWDEARNSNMTSCLFDARIYNSMCLYCILSIGCSCVCVKQCSPAIHFMKCNMTSTKSVYPGTGIWLLHIWCDFGGPLFTIFRPANKSEQTNAIRQTLRTNDSIRLGRGLITWQ